MESAPLLARFVVPNDFDADLAHFSVACAVTPMCAPLTCLAEFHASGRPSAGKSFALVPSGWRTHALLIPTIWRVLCRFPSTSRHIFFFLRFLTCAQPNLCSSRASC